MKLNVRNRSSQMAVLVVTAALFLFAEFAQARRFFNPPAEITEYRLDSRVSMPMHMGFDDQSNLWVGAFRDGKLLRYTYNGETQVYDVTTQDIDPSRGPMNLWVDPRDGGVWFSAIPANIVNVKVDGTVHTYDIPTPRSMPMGVSGDTHGNVWFSEMFGNKIGVIRPSGQIEEFDIPHKLSMPAGITVDRYDNKWFAMTAPGKIGVLRANGTFGFYNLPIGAHPMGIQHSRHQKTDLVWFTETVGNSIGSISPLTGKIQLYRVPTFASVPMMIMEDALGQVWFTEFAGNQIGFRGLNGRILEYDVPTRAAGPMGLDINPRDQSIWFTEVLRNRIGRMVNPSVPSGPPMPPMPMATD